MGVSPAPALLTRLGNITPPSPPACLWCQAAPASTLGKVGASLSSPTAAGSGEAALPGARPLSQERSLGGCEAAQTPVSGIAHGDAECRGGLGGLPSARGARGHPRWHLVLHTCPREARSGSSTVAPSARPPALQGSTPCVSALTAWHPNPSGPPKPCSPPEPWPSRAQSCPLIRGPR